MKRQQSLDSYFRIKAKPNILDDSTLTIKNKLLMENEKTAKKRSLSIQRKSTPSKSPKTIKTPTVHDSVIEKDDENSPHNSDLSLSGASDSTILYSPPSFLNTPYKYGTPRSNRKSDKKIFSPERRRQVVKRSPKVVRNLTIELNKECIQEDEELSKACEGFNDTTIFFLKMIHKFLKNEALKKLIDEKEQQLLSKCFQVRKPGMLLVCRLYWHQDHWQRWEKLCKITSSFQEVDTVNMNQVVDSLVEFGFLMKPDNQVNKLTFDELVHILKHEELKKIGKDLLKKNFKTKEETVKALRNFSKVTVNMSMFIKASSSNNMSRLLKIMSEAAGNCYKLTGLARNTLYKIYLLSFLGMNYSIIREKTLELVLLHDKINRETYPIDKSMELDDASVVFRNKDDFDKYLTAHYIYEEYQQMNDTPKKCELVEQVYEMYKNISDKDAKSYKSLPAWLRMFTPANLYIKILSEGITDLKRLKSDTHYQLCLNILSTLIGQNAFRQHKKADWYAEKALILLHLQKYDEAAEILLEGFNSSMAAESKDALRARAKKIATQKNITVSDELRQELLAQATRDDMLEKNLHGEHIFKNRVEKSSARGKVKFITKTEDGLIEQDAELCCITHYVDVKGEYTHGEHWEGRIVNAIFFLLFWDIIYHRLHGFQGIYLSYFQRYPLDMFTESFYVNRKTLIEDRLKEIESWSEEQLIEFMHKAYMKVSETDVSAVTRIEWSSLRAVTACLGPAVGALCRPLALNYRHKHSGFPDLTLWNEHTGKIKFVEVKTDTDKPSVKQIQWMHYLQEQNIDTEFCYIGTNTTRCKARGGVTNKKDTVVNTTETTPDEPKKIEESSNFEGLNTSLLVDVTSDDSDDFETNAKIEKIRSITPKKATIQSKRKVVGPKRKSKNNKPESDENVKKGNICPTEIKTEIDLVNDQRKKSKTACHIVFEDDFDEDLSLIPEEMLEVTLLV